MIIRNLMKKPISIPFNRPSLIGNEMIYIEEAFTNSHLSGDGPFTKRCHALLEALLDVPKVLLTTSCTHALEMTALLLDIKPGDEVIIPSPYWVSYPEMVKASGATPVIADCLTDDSFKLTPEILKNHLSKNTKLLILNSPSNPTGALYTPKELETLSEIILKNDLLVISDEIYEHLVYDGEFHSIAQISRKLKEKTIIVNGVSKAYSMTGWRIGYAAGNAEIIKACRKLQSHSTSNPTTFAQAGAVMALTSPEGTEAIRKMAKEFKKRRDYIYNELNLISRIKVTKPAGAFYIFPYIGEYLGGEIASSYKFAEKILNEKFVALVPGEGFGAPSYIRISYATGMEELVRGLERIKEFLKEIKS